MRRRRDARAPRRRRYGTISGAGMHSLLRLMNGVYAPQIFGSKAWPESIKKDFTGHFHKVRRHTHTRTRARVTHAMTRAAWRVSASRAPPRGRSRGGAQTTDTQTTNNRHRHNEINNANGFATGVVARCARIGSRIQEDVFFTTGIGGARCVRIRGCSRIQDRRLLSRVATQRDHRRTSAAPAGGRAALLPSRDMSSWRA